MATTLNSRLKVVTDVDEIFKLNKTLGKKLKDILPVKQKRDITSPSGAGNYEVFFESRRDKKARAWAPFIEDDQKLKNFFLAGDPLSNDLLQIEVQINFPAGEYNRRVAGVFVVDPHGSVFIAHRGKLTKGRAGLKRSKVLEGFSTQVIEAQDNDKISSVILVSSLEDTEIANNIWEFAKKSREVAARIESELH